MKKYTGKFSPISIIALICSLLGCLGIVGIVLGVIDLTEQDGRKRGLSIAAIIIGFVLTMAVIAAVRSNPDAQKDAETVGNTEDVTEVATEAPETTAESNVVEVTEPVTEAQTETTTQDASEESTEEPENNTGANGADGTEIEIVAGELGEYGKELVLNAGTEFEDKTIGHFVPTGKYEIKNIGDDRTQVNVYKNEKKMTENGWEEWADGKAELLFVGDTKEMTIEDGYFINVDEPSHIVIKMIEAGNTEGEPNTTETLREEFNSKLGDTKPSWYEKVPKDKTGNWRELVVYSNKPIDKDLAIEYSKAYINSEEEVHWIPNLYLKTVTRLNKMGNLLFVTTTEYRDHEESDAAELGGGMMLDEYCVNLDTGELINEE